MLAAAAAAAVGAASPPTRACARGRCSPRSASPALAVATLAGDEPARRRRPCSPAARRRRSWRSGSSRRWSYRRPGLIGLLALGAIPFRVPLALGDETASLLLPLYGVVAAGALAEAFRWLRPGTGPDALDVAERPVAPAAAPRADRARRVRRALRAAGGLLDRPRGGAEERLPLLRPVRRAASGCWATSTGARCGCATRFWLVAGLAVVFAAVGFYEYATGHLLLSNAKVQESNDLKPYFRVNSLFFDPNIYGRFLALTMIALAATLVWTPQPPHRAARRRRARRAVGGAGALAVAVELRGAARRPGRARRAALEAAAGPGRDRGAGRARGRRGAALPRLAGDRHPLDRLAGQGDQRPLRPRHAARCRWRATGRCGASAPAPSPSATGPARACAPSAWRRSRTRSRSRSRPSRALIGLLAYLALMVAAFRLVFGGVRARVRAAGPRDRGGRRRRGGRGVLRARAAHPRVRGVPRGPPLLGAAGAGRRPGGPARRAAPRRASGTPSPSERPRTLDRCLLARSQSSLP